MKRSFRLRLFLPFLAIFTIFSVVTVFLQREQERRLRTAAIEQRLDDYADKLFEIKEKHPSYGGDELAEFLPNDLRLSIINREGQVVYDNFAPKVQLMGNHSQRPEILLAQKKGIGTDLRLSRSTNEKYFYFVKAYPQYYIRLALPFYSRAYDFVKISNSFLYYICVLFLLTMALVHYTAGRFSRSIEGLRTFAAKLQKNNSKELAVPKFPDDELGEIARYITANYLKLKQSEGALANEREKLLQHIHVSREGICFYDSDNKALFFNGLFIQYLNTISKDSNSDPTEVFSTAPFQSVAEYIQRKRGQGFSLFDHKISAQGKTFAVRASLSEDDSLELVLTDITRQERLQELKQQLTGNITHELSTPLTGIRVSLETVLNTHIEMSEEKRLQFISNAYKQSLLLSELIRDIGLISKIEERSSLFSREPVRLLELVEDVMSDLEDKVVSNESSVEIGLPDSCIVYGNRTLLYSIFRNLAENALRYAGKGITISIALKGEEAGFYRLSFADNGIGVKDEKHLPRIFERFYRIDDGRSRDTGGSGLGLSIVRNSVAFHKGTIMVKNRAEGGLEFLFRLPKMDAKRS